MKPTLTYPLNDKQLIFDYVWHHFVVEGNPRAVMSVDAGDQCVYDSPTGGCAIGCLMPEVLRKRIGHTLFSVGHAFDGVDQQHPAYPFVTDIREMFGPDINARFLVDLQCCHDRPEYTDGMADRLRQLAHRYDLVVPQ